MKEILKTIDLSIGYKKKQSIHSNIDIQLFEGDIIALIGPNGAGKTTLFKTLTGNIKPIDGQVLLMGKELNSYTASERASLFSIVLTERPDDMFIKVFDIVATGRYPHIGLMARLSDTDYSCIEKSLQTTGIAHLINRTFASLSDGERQKVMIAKSLAQNTPLIYMDEPTAFLDYTSKIELMNLMKKLSEEEHKTILFSSHDMELLLRYCDKLWLMAKDKAFIAGKSNELIENGTLDEYFNLSFSKGFGTHQIEI